MKHYELMYILPAKLEEDVKASTVDTVNELITKDGGIIKDHNVWISRKLSYPIKHVRQGVYMLAHFSIDPEHLSRLNREMTLEENILRHLIVSFDPRKGAVAAPQSDTRATQHPSPTTSTTVPEEKPVPDETDKASLEDLDKKLDELLSDGSEVK